MQGLNSCKINEFFCYVTLKNKKNSSIKAKELNSLENNEINQRLQSFNYINYSLFLL